MRALTDGLVGKPYGRGGRGPDAFDCAGLVVELQRRQGVQVQIPKTPPTDDRAFMAMVFILCSEWTELDRPRPGCIVFFASQAHVGTMLDGHRFLHTTEEFGESYVESLQEVPWNNKHRRFYVAKEQM